MKTNEKKDGNQLKLMRINLKTTGKAYLQRIPLKIEKI